MENNRSNQGALLLLVASLLVGVVAFFFHEGKAPPRDPVRIVYESTGGLVIFDHAAHSARAKDNCMVCHHYDGDDEVKESCRDCHEAAGIPFLHAYHEKGEDFADDDAYQSCMSCHEAGGMDPKNCRGCHK